MTLFHLKLFQNLALKLVLFLLMFRHVGEQDKMRGLEMISPAIGSHGDSPALPDQAEIQFMAVFLKRKFGTEAAELAQFFSREQKYLGDFERAKIWAEVEEHILQADSHEGLRLKN